MQNQNLFKEYEGVFKPETEENSDDKKPKERIFAYNPFPLQNAVGEKNVKKIWIEYEKLRLAGIVAEELIYKITNKIRDMLVLKSFGVKNWKEEELKKFYTKLVEIYHKSRMESNNDLDIAIEKTILNI